MGYYIFGCGDYGRKVYDILNSNEIIGFIDNNQDKCSTLFLNKKVYHISEIEQDNENQIIIGVMPLSKAEAEIENQLLQYGMSYLKYNDIVARLAYRREKVSNPAVFLLSECIIRQDYIRVEDNIGESIHVHIGNFRISLSINEFIYVANAIIYAGKEMLKLKGIEFECLDLSSLDWEWLCKYNQIESIKEKSVRLGDLLTIKRVSGKNFIIPLNESRLVCAFNGDTEEMEEFEQSNLYNMSNTERLKSVANVIAEKGYPFDNKYIMINQYNQIYDGDHRAAYLFNLYGAEYIIPVIEITFKDEKKPVIEAYSGYMVEKKHAIDDQIEKFYYNDSKELLKILNTNNIKYYSVSYMPDNLIIVIDAEGMGTIKKKFPNGSESSIECIYGLDKPFHINFKDKNIVITTALYCKSMLNGALMPLDKFVQAYAWNNIRLEQSTGYWISDEVISYLIQLTRCIFDDGIFDEYAKDYFEKYVNFVYDINLQCIMKKVFFGASDGILHDITNKEYDCVVDHYLKFKKY